MTTATALRENRRFLDLGAMSALEHLRFTTGHRIEGPYSGRHRSRVRGGAGEFVDYQQYSDGDDLRRIDWKVLARTGRAYLRVFQDETNLICTIVMDASRSMLFGDNNGTKLEYAQYFATAISHLIARQKDQVGLALIGGGLDGFHPPGSTPGHMALLHEAIETMPTSESTNLGQGLRDLFPQLTTRGVLLLLSDFLVDDPEDVFQAARMFRHRHFEVIALHLVHPHEEDLPEGAALRMVDLETKQTIDCSPDQIRERYRARFEAHCQMIRTLALAAGCEYRRVSTATPYLKTLGGFLVQRSGY
jgi:uncharacterized protein (DUF58 family)